MTAKDFIQNLCTILEVNSSENSFNVLKINEEKIEPKYRCKFMEIEKSFYDNMINIYYTSQGSYKNAKSLYNEIERCINALATYYHLTENITVYICITSRSSYDYLNEYREIVLPINKIQ